MDIFVMRVKIIVFLKNVKEGRIRILKNKVLVLLVDLVLYEIVLLQKELSFHNLVLLEHQHQLDLIVIESILEVQELFFINLMELHQHQNILIAQKEVIVPILNQQIMDENIYSLQATTKFQD